MVHIKTQINKKNNFQIIFLNFIKKNIQKLFFENKLKGFVTVLPYQSDQLPVVHPYFGRTFPTNSFRAVPRRVSRDITLIGRERVVIYL